MSRKDRIVAMRIAGYHGDKREWTRLYCEGAGRLSIATANDAWRAGLAAKSAGARCSCFECKEAS